MMAGGQGIRLILLAGSAMLVGVHPAAAQTVGAEGSLADQIVNCAALQDDTPRLECFDGVAGPLVGIVDGEGDDAEIFANAGSGHWESEVLRMDGRWRAVWRIDARIFSLELRDGSGTLLQTLSTETGEAGGRSEVFEAGEYRLSVRALGNWRVGVIEEE